MSSHSEFGAGRGSDTKGEGARKSLPTILEREALRRRDLEAMDDASEQAWHDRNDGESW